MHGSHMNRLRRRAVARQEGHISWWGAPRACLEAAFQEFIHHQSGPTGTAGMRDLRFFLAFPSGIALI